MPILTAADARALMARFQVTDNGGVLYVDALSSVGVELRVRQHARSSALSPAIARLSAEFDTLTRILERTEWQREMARAGQLPHTAWCYFATCDMEYFYVVLRAVFDHIPHVCTHLPVRPGLIPTKSFGHLRSWCEEHPHARALLGDTMVAAVLDCEWFLPMRDTRDHIVHQGAFALAMPIEGGAIGFRVYSDPEHLGSIPIQLHINENLADFELYVAWTMGNLLQLFDVLGTLLRDKYLDGPPMMMSGQSAGHRLHRQHLERLAAAFDRQVGTDPTPASE